MAVVEGFVSHGEPCDSVNKLGSKLDRRYEQWSLLVLLQRQWSRNKRLNVLYAPVFHMLFASSAPEVYDCCDFTTKADELPWQLLFYDVKYSCREVFWESRGAELIKEIFQSVPSGLRPLNFSVICVKVGNTHERLGLFSERAFSLYKERVESVLLPLGLQQISIQRRDVDFSSHAKELLTGSTGPLPLFIESAVSWVRNRSPEAADVSAPSQEGNESILAILPHLNKLLFTTEFVELDDVKLEDTGISEGRKESILSQLEIGRLEVIKDMKKRVGRVTSFSLNLPTPSGEAPKQWYVLLIQKLRVEKQEVSLENLDPGPLRPQPIGAELHLMQDAGEVLYLQSRLRDEKFFDTTYDDMLHENGEVFAQLTPLEGISFQDIDNYFSFLEKDELKEFVKTVPIEPICEGSCSAHTFPRIVFRRPTGLIVKDTAISSPHVEVVETTVSTSDEWEAVRQAFVFLSDNITVLNKSGLGGYTLAKDIAPVPSPTHNNECTWCGRRRDKLLRCGGCKVDMYCGKNHQMMDWKAGHKKKCGLWRKARDDYEQSVVPLLHSTETKLPSTPYASAVTTLLQFINSWRSKLKGQTSPIIHILGIGRDVKDFLSELAKCPLKLRGDWKQLRLLLCSDAFSAEEQNAVYAISETGDYTRTMSTSVLGDVWHKQSGKVVEDAALLVRLYSTKYHIFIDNSLSQGAVANSIGISSTSNNDGGFAPAAVISLGTLLGSGMTYFTAAAEIIADYFFGVIPVMCTETTFLSAYNTLEAMLARVKSSSTITADRKNKLLAKYGNIDNSIQLNSSAFCSIPLGTVEVNTNTPLALRQMTHLTSHANLYYFSIPVES
ncbi:zinc finger protein [Trypanosoma melophagium]|uniref:zinc finger protein n=1 Tax=Trypanosoma melophagium TaxID=715481 RepID=UPI00351A4044|nr:zinc finger protein [Trypanosoma melophagium]